jgi:signal peptidase I
MLTVAYLIQRPLGIVGVSMEPTLKSTDKVVVDIVTYRFRPPRVGEVVIFNPPFSHNYKGVPDGASETFCKRIVAVGGEEVLLKDGIVYVDGVKRVFGRKIEDNVSSENSSKTQRPILRKQGEIYGVIRPYRVPSGYYFVLGDNIANSEDSRFFEAIPRQAITGKVTKIYLPWSRAGPVD